MTDNLKITTPISTNETINKVHPKEISSNIPVIDPAKVGSRNEQQPSNAQQNTIDYQFNQQSVYNKFLQQFQTAAGLSSTLKKILFDAFLRQNTPIQQNNLDILLNKAASKFQMGNPAQINDLMKYLQNNNTKFSGDFFEMLRNISSAARQNNDEEFPVLLGQFLKSYDNHMSAEDTLNTILYACRNLSLMMRRTAAEQMNQYVVRLESFSTEPFKATDILKREVIPFLSKYINSTNDLGKARNTVAMIVHNLARMNTGSIENVNNHFSCLTDYCRYNLNLSHAQLKLIETLYEKALSEPDKENEYFQTFIEMLKNGIHNNESAVSKAMYKDIANSLLLDQNTFMPLTHIFLPVNYNGAFMFTEIWIDKQQNSSSSEEYQNDKKLRLFLTFDIQNLGYFETVIQISGKNAEITLNYPNTLKNKNKEIKETVGAIFSNQGFNVKNINVSAGAIAQKLDKIFPNIYERKQTVNVSI